MFYIDRDLDDFDTTKIESITIIGCIASFCISVEEGEKFATKYSLKNNWLDDNGMNIDILLPAPANQENLAELFARFEDEDFSQKLKEGFLEEYQIFNTKASIHYLIHLIKDYKYFFDRSIMQEEQQLLKKTMPVYMDIITQVETTRVNWPSVITVENTELDTNEVLRTWLTSIKHIGFILMPLQKALEKYQEDLISKDELIKKLKPLLYRASVTPFPDFGSLLPSLRKELSEHVLFVDDKLNDLYSTIANQLTNLLETQDLQFTPQEFPCPKASEYLQINVEKNEFIDTTPRYNKARSRIDELKESEDINELLDFSPHTLKSLQMPEKSGSIKKQSDFLVLNGQATPYRFSPYRSGKTRARTTEVSWSVKKPSDFSPRVREFEGLENIKKKLDFSPKAINAIEHIPDTQSSNSESCSYFLLRVLVSKELKIGAFILLAAGAIALTAGSLGILGMAAGTATALTYAGGVTVGVGACLGLVGFFSSCLQKNSNENETSEQREENNQFKTGLMSF